jgi:hypothetical protein
MIISPLRVIIAMISEKDLAIDMFRSEKVIEIAAARIPNEQVKLLQIIIRAKSSCEL